MLRKNFPRRKEQRREEAVERQAARMSRTNKQQLELLNRKLGKGVGAVKERNRLSKES